MRSTYDVIVIGGGPAGSATAGFLAKSGISVALLERARHPRYQVGESLLPHFWRFIEALGATEAIEAEGFIKKAGGTMYWDREFRQFAFKDMGYPRPALHVERSAFDAILFRHAGALGAETFEDTAVVSADTSDEGCVVRAKRAGDDSEVELRSKWVVDASGQAGFLAKKHKLRTIDESFRYIGLWGYFQGSKFVAIDGSVHPESDRGAVGPTTFVASLETPEGKNKGWGWNIQLRKTTSVGLIIAVDEVSSEQKRDLEGFFEQTCRSMPYFGALLEDATMEPGSLHVHRDYSYRPSSFVGPGYFLAGDAGAFADPIFSQGVQFALYSAFLASLGVEGALAGNAKRAKAQYDSRATQYYEFSRSLALPNYDPNAEISSSVSVFLQRMPRRELELMHVASAMTDRSENFVKMARSAGLSAEPAGLRKIAGLTLPDGTSFRPGGERGPR